MSETLAFDGRGCTANRRRTYEGNDPNACGKIPHACGIAIDMAGLRGFLTDRHPVKTAECVSGQTGVPVKTVERWLSTNPSEPSGLNMVRLYIVYRAPLLAAALVNCPDWLNDEAIAAKNAELDRRMEEIRAQKIMGWRE